MLPDPGTMRAHVREWFGRRLAIRDPVEPVLLDAGIDLAIVDQLEAEAWSLSDDGGVALDAGVRSPVLHEACVAPPDLACFARRDAGAPDAGPCVLPGEPTVPRGCGCGAADGSVLVALLGFAAAVRKRRR